MGEKWRMVLVELPQRSEVLVGLQMRQKKAKRVNSTLNNYKQLSLEGERGLEIRGNSWKETSSCSALHVGFMDIFNSDRTTVLSSTFRQKDQRNCDCGGAVPTSFEFIPSPRVDSWLKFDSDSSLQISIDCLWLRFSTEKFASILTEIQRVHSLQKTDSIRLPFDFYSSGSSNWFQLWLYSEN